MQCDAPGSPDDAANLNDEWVEILNVGTTAVNLNGWSLHEQAGNITFMFPPQYTVAAGAHVKIHTGSGSDSATDLYWQRSEHLWNNTADNAYLTTPTGGLTIQKRC